MKYFLLLIFLTSQLLNCKAQQFSFQINFVDSLGYSDSLILGYDDLATDSIDPSFGELNLGQWFITGAGMEVRNTDALNHIPYPSHTTKKQIVKNHCGQTGISIIEIDISNAHWPVTATWNNSWFNDPCRNGSFLTSVNPSGWWGTGSPSNLGLISLSNTNSTMFTSNCANPSDTNFCYWLVDGHFVDRYWLAFGDSTLLPNSIYEFDEIKHPLKLFPNPSDSKFNIQSPKSFGEIKTLEIYSSIGILIKNSESLTSFDLNLFDNGIYFIVITNNKGEKLSTIAAKN
jgi:hypothetical protein